MYKIVVPILVFFISSCSKTNYKKVSTIIDEDCIVINDLFVVKNNDSVWELKTVEEEHLYYFPNMEEAETTKLILEHYQTKYLCNCGDGFYTNSAGEENPLANIMLFQLTMDNSGIGNNEINSYSNPNGDWYLIEKPGHSMFGFGKNKEACLKALGAIKKYGFNQSCFVGRANASFSYLKRYREDIDTLRNM